LNVLHIWDQAGVACILAKYQRRRGDHVTILKRSSYDPFAIFSFYNESLINADGKQFLKLAVKEAKVYDVIHVHTLFKIVPELRRRYKDKRIVLHYHGSEVRGKDVDPIRLEAEDKSDVILVSTPDLLNYVKNDKVQHLSNPVDTEHFRKNSSRESSARSLMITSDRMDIQWILSHLARSNLNLNIDTTIDRSSNPVPYSKLPSLLYQYSVYIDIKYIDGVLLTSLSKTALEALAGGLKVLTYNLQYIEELPRVNEPEYAVDRVLDIYQV
jgi:glycosyltransferase involved in cell wall biosynthesis